MKLFRSLMRKKHVTTHRSPKEVEARFLRLYSMWHETHDIALRKRLFVKLNILMRRIPDYNLRRSFEQAF